VVLWEEDGRFRQTFEEYHGDGRRRATATDMEEGNFPSETVFTITSAIEKHISKEDLGTNASEWDCVDLRTLRNQLQWWEDMIYVLGHQEKEMDRWSQVLHSGHSRGNTRSNGTPGPPTTPAKQMKTKVSCFHASTRLRIFTEDRGISEYKRMDKLVKGDKLCVRRFSSNSRGVRTHVGIVECVMTFACQPTRQHMVEVEGNLQ